MARHLRQTSRLGVPSPIVVIQLLFSIYTPSKILELKKAGRNRIQIILLEASFPYRPNKIMKKCKILSSQPNEVGFFCAIHGINFAIFHHDSFIGIG